MSKATKKVIASEDTLDIAVNDELKLTKPQAAKIRDLKTWTDKFRYLRSEGYKTAQISKITGKRYQQVRNALVAPAKKVDQ